MTDNSVQDRSQRFVLGDEERMVRDTARDFIADRMPVSRLRSLGEAGFDRDAWSEMAALGWPGIAISEEFGGSGLGIRALAIVIEEMGKTLAAAPLASTALVAATVIARFAPRDVSARWLPGIAEGSVIAALAADEAAHPTEALPQTSLASVGTSTVIDGAKRYVADGAAADLLLVSAAQGDARVLALVRADSPGVKIEQRDTIDRRGLAEIRFDAVPIDAVLTAANGRNPVEHALDYTRIGLAAEMLGACSRAFEVTLDYMRTRRQFGQLIGSFQALQHRAAKLFIELELARSCVLAAVDALHRDDGDLASLASLAKSVTAELMRVMSYEMIQLHGGIGMTDEHPIGHFYRRLTMIELMFGDSGHHLELLARAG